MRGPLACKATGQPEPTDPPAVVRCILDSLALAHRLTVRQAQQLSGRHVDVVHIVGGELAELRALVRRTQPIRRYEPTGGEAPRREAARRIGLTEA